MGRSEMCWSVVLDVDCIGEVPVAAVVAAGVSGGDNGVVCRVEVKFLAVVNGRCAFLGGSIGVCDGDRKGDRSRSRCLDVDGCGSSSGPSWVSSGCSPMVSVSVLYRISVSVLWCLLGSTVMVVSDPSSSSSVVGCGLLADLRGGVVPGSGKSLL